MAEAEVTVQDGGALKSADGGGGAFRGPGDEADDADLDVFGVECDFLAPLESGLTAAANYDEATNGATKVETTFGAGGCCSGSLSSFS
jgi:hypothetical protein